MEENPTRFCKLLGAAGHERGEPRGSGGRRIHEPPGVTQAAAAVPGDELPPAVVQPDRRLISDVAAELRCHRDTVEPGGAGLA